MSGSHLRTEIIESQKVRSDLMKWKIIAIAVIGSIGFGVSKTNNTFELALCIIPFVMAYIDALCLHITLRILSISKWHQSEPAKELENNDEFIYMGEYEKYAKLAWKAGAFNLDKWTVFFSSLVINLALITAPLFDEENKLFQFGNYIILCGAIGLAVTIFLRLYVNRTKKKIENIEYPEKGDEQQTESEG